MSSVKCLTCARVSTREETFQDLSLPIPGKDHLAVIHQNQSIPTNHSQTQSTTSSSSAQSSSQQQQQQPQQGINGVTTTCTDAVYQAGQDGWIWWFWNLIKSFLWGPAVSLHDCLAAFFSDDVLKGDNMYR